MHFWCINAHCFELFECCVLVGVFNVCFAYPWTFSTVYVIIVIGSRTASAVLKSGCRRRPVGDRSFFSFLFPPPRVMSPVVTLVFAKSGEKKNFRTVTYRRPLPARGFRSPSSPFYRHRTLTCALSFPRFQQQTPSRSASCWAKPSRTLTPARVSTHSTKYTTACTGRPPWRRPTKTRRTNCTFTRQWCVHRLGLPVPAMPRRPASRWPPAGKIPTGTVNHT